MAHIQTETEWEEEMSNKILQFIRHELYLELRYMEPALAALAYRRMDGLGTFATDGISLFYSAEPVLRIFKNNSPFLDRVYLHAILHCIFRHLWLRGQREQQLWNIACDIAVEYTIDSMNKTCTRRILSWLRKNTYEMLERDVKGISAATIYRWLKAQEQEQILELAKEFYTDDHRFWPKEEEQNAPVVQQAKQNWDKVSRQVTLEQNRKGDEPEEGEEVFAAQVQAGKSRRSYGDFLRKFAVFREETHLDPEEFDLGFYSYGLKLYGNLPFIEPLETREVHRIREIVIVIDTSYSTSGALVEGFLKETFSILTQKNSFFQKFSIRILQCDNQVQMDQRIESQQELERFVAELQKSEFQIAGGGGTDFRPAFSYVEKLREQGELGHLGGLLYFTDGKGIYPKRKPEYKTAFLFLEEYDELAVPPWAMRLKLEPEEWLHEH